MIVIRIFAQHIQMMDVDNMVLIYLFNNNNNRVFVWEICDGLIVDKISGHRKTVPFASVIFGDD